MKRAFDRTKLGVRNDDVKGSCNDDCQHEKEYRPEDAVATSRLCRGYRVRLIRRRMNGASTMNGDENVGFSDKEPAIQLHSAKHIFQIHTDSDSRGGAAYLSFIDKK